MSLRNGLLQNFASPIGIVIAGGVLAGSLAIFKGDEIAESVKPVKTALTNFFEFANQSGTKTPEAKVPVAKPVEKTASNPAGLSSYEAAKPEMK